MRGCIWPSRFAVWLDWQMRLCRVVSKLIFGCVRDSQLNSSSSAQLESIFPTVLLSQKTLKRITQVHKQV